jgi:hypothetical protein
MDDSKEHQQEVFRKATTLADHLHSYRLTPADEKRLEKNKTIESWSEESIELATKVAYQKPDGSGILNHVPVVGRSPIADAAPEAGSEYAARAHAIAEARVVLAARRLSEKLAQLLNGLVQ